MDFNLSTLFAGNYSRIRARVAEIDPGVLSLTNHPTNTEFKFSQPVRIVSNYPQGAESEKYGAKKGANRNKIRGKTGQNKGHFSY